MSMEFRLALKNLLGICDNLKDFFLAWDKIFICSPLKNAGQDMKNSVTFSILEKFTRNLGAGVFFVLFLNAEKFRVFFHALLLVGSPQPVSEHPSIRGFIFAVYGLGTLAVWLRHSHTTMPSGALYSKD